MYNTRMNRGDRLEQLAKWRTEAQADLIEAQAELASAEHRLQACRERLHLLDRLLAVEESATAAPAEAHPASEPAGGRVTSLSGLRPDELSSATAPWATEARADELLDACERVVREAGRPLHISELHKALLGSSVAIPGRGTEANLLVRLHRASERFVRTGRGTYAPPDMAPEVRPVQKRRVRRRT